MTKVRGVRATGHRLQVAGCGLRVTGRGNDGSRADLSSPKVEKPAAGSWQRAPLLFENRKAPPMMARLFFFYPKFRIPDPENKSAKMFG